MLWGFLAELCVLRRFLPSALAHGCTLYKDRGRDSYGRQKALTISDFALFSALAYESKDAKSRNTLQLHSKTSSFLQAVTSIGKTSQKNVFVCFSLCARFIPFHDASEEGIVRGLQRIFDAPKLPHKLLADMDIYREIQVAT